MYEYEAHVNRIIDGDTVELNIDLGFKMSVTEKCRLDGIDTAELRSRNPELKKFAYEAKEFLVKLIEGKKVKIKSISIGKYGRPLVEIYLAKRSINKLLLKKHLAIGWDGTGGKRDREARLMALLKGF